MIVEEGDRGRSTLLPECLEDWIGEDNSVRVIDVFVDELNLAEFGFARLDPEPTCSIAYSRLLEWGDGNYDIDQPVDRVRDLLHRVLKGDQDAQRRLETILAKNHLTLDDAMNG